MFYPLGQPSRNYYMSEITPAGGWQTTLQKGPDKLKQQYYLVSGTIHNLSEEADGYTKNYSLWEPLRDCGFFSWANQAWTAKKAYWDFLKKPFCSVSEEIILERNLLLLNLPSTFSWTDAQYRGQQSTVVSNSRVGLPHNSYVTLSKHTFCNLSLFTCYMNQA